MLTQDHEKQTASRSSGVVARVAAVAGATFLFAVAARTTLSNQPDLFTTSPQPEARGMGQTMKMGFAAMSGDEAAMDAASDQASGMASDAAANGAAAAMEHGPALVDFAKLLAAEGVKGYKEHQANQENNRHEEQGHQGWGSDADEHGCRASSGYSWCAPKNKCMRAWEGSCEYDQQHQRNSDRLPSGWSSAVALDRWDRKTYYFCSAVPIERRESAQWERPTQPCSESTHSKNAGNRQCTYRDNNLRNNGPRCYMEGVNECAGQCLTHAFRPSYYTNGVCYATMSQCTSGITAQNNWMSATGHYRCYQNERGRCVPKDQKPRLGKHQGDPGCYNTPEDCVSFGGGRKSRELDSTMLLTDSAAVEEPAEENQGLFDSVFSFFK